MTLRMLTGEGAVGVVRGVLEGWGLWGVMLWDVALEVRRGVLGEALSGSEVFVVEERGAVSACAWTRAAMPGGRAAVTHFCCRGREEGVRAARLFLESREVRSRYDALMGVIPAPYRHARSFVRELGFSERLIPGLCCLPERRRCVTGALVVRCL